jgi:hypothetical protein
LIKAPDRSQILPKSLIEHWRARTAGEISSSLSDQTSPSKRVCGSFPFFAAARNPPRHDLSENIRSDAPIVGAGITGSLTAER